MYETVLTDDEPLTGVLGGGTMFSVAVSTGGMVLHLPTTLVETFALACCELTPYNIIETILSHASAGKYYHGTTGGGEQSNAKLFTGRGSSSPGWLQHE